MIDFREIIGEHSGENLAHAVWETLELYGLKGRVSVLCLVSTLRYHAELTQVIVFNCDNASNNDTMMEELEHLPVRAAREGLPLHAGRPC